LVLCKPRRSFSPCSSFSDPVNEPILVPCIDTSKDPAALSLKRSSDAGLTSALPAQLVDRRFFQSAIPSSQKPEGRPLHG
jgi:hypothetical protein